MKALVTGAAGFAGTHLVPHLLDQGDQVTATLLPADSVKLECESALLDISDIDQCREVLATVKPDVIYNLAGISFVPDAARDVSLTVKVNVLGVYNLFSACKELGLNKTKILVISSSQVYGRVSEKELPLREGAPLKPAENYSMSKAMAEMVVHRFSHPGDPPSVIVRAFNHIGPAQRSDFVVSSFARQLAEISLGKRAAEMKIGNLEARRDFTDVRDIVRAYRLAALKGRGVYNLCSGRAVSIKEILDKLLEISGLKVELKQDPDRMRPSETPVLYGSFKLAEKELGWRPEIPLEQSLKDTYDYWLAKLS
ncbi:MAG: NAD-dependent epimerase/dehydratase family protein [Candidatus Dadabacteria bacterium]|nr:MAG: NAD-dependent epimerase/dehydratase family protein [Candidatus Dadabacteria bacterium]